MLKIKKDGLFALNFIIKRQPHPIIIATYSEDEQAKLDQELLRMNHLLLQPDVWCNAHGYAWQYLAIRRA